ncbi:hypothetical protein IMSAGC020_02529 [Lachnospiraceae bacterium]|jgi:membrane protease YdiL (CAAX protease family)|nr:hypothetical protein IMSAGC020_02529 [Lachnospiraceae bacterium]
MKKISKKQGIAFLIIVIYELIAIIYTPVIVTSFIGGIVVSFLGIGLCLGIIHFYLQEPLTEYGVHLKKVHLQIISGIVLTFLIVFLLIQGKGDFRWSSFLFYLNRLGQKFSSDPVNIVYFLIPLINVIAEEVLYRGFLLTFFQKIFNSSMLSIWLSAILFGISHYPSNNNIAQVISASIMGLIYGYLRVNESEKFSLFSLCLTHYLHNIFLIYFFFYV